MGLFSKLFNAAFVSMRMNTQHPLYGTDLKEVLVGAIYAEQQSAYLNSYETGIKPADINTILQEYWDIHSGREAVQTLDYLLEKGHRFYFDQVYAAVTTEKDRYAEYLEHAFPDKADLERAVQFFRGLRASSAMLIENKVIDKIEDTKKYGVDGWDYGRLSFIARLCYEKDLISKAGLKHYLQEALSGTKAHYRNWEDFSKAYIIGRALWGGSHNAGMIAIAKDLLTNKKSPWVAEVL